MQIHKPNSFVKQKLVWLAALALVVIGVMTGVWFASNARHEQIISEVKGVRDNVKRLTDTAMADRDVTPDERLAAIKDLSQTKTLKHCNGEWWNEWYSALAPTAKAQLKACEHQLKQIQAVASAATKLHLYLVDDAKIAKTLVLLKVANGTEASQRVALSSAESALRDIEAIGVTAENKALLIASKEKIMDIIDRWNSLNKASKDQNRETYQTAKDDLAQAYADLGEVSDISDKQVQALVLALKKAS